MGRIAAMLGRSALSEVGAARTGVATMILAIPSAGEGALPAEAANAATRMAEPAAAAPSRKAGLIP